MASSTSIDLYSFGNYDRSGKIRWLAEELELNVNEHRLELGAHRQSDYRALNPYSAVPTVVYNEQTLIESTAACHFLAEQFPLKKLTITPNENDRYEFLKWMAIGCETMESRLVDYTISQSGLMAKELQPIYEKTLKFKFKIILEQMPTSPFLVGNRLTIADIVIGYVLKLGVVSKLLDWSQVSNYMHPLSERPAAIRAQFFDNLKTFMK